MLNSYDLHIKECKKIANIIWEEPFFTGLDKLKKWQLQLIIESLTEKLDYHENIKDNFEDERDIKDIMFDEKCLLIEALDPNFFNGGEV